MDVPGTAAFAVRLLAAEQFASWDSRDRESGGRSAHEFLELIGRRLESDPRAGEILSQFRDTPGDPERRSQLLASIVAAFAEDADFAEYAGRLAERVPAGLAEPLESGGGTPENNGDSDESAEATVQSSITVSGSVLKNSDIAGGNIDKRRTVKIGTAAIGVLALLGGGFFGARSLNSSHGPSTSGHSVVSGSPTAAAISSAPAESVSPTSSPSVMAGPLGSGGNPFAGTLALVDGSGYSTSVTWSFTFQEPTKDIANQPPGHAYATMAVAGQIEETNTTPGRNYPALEDKFAIGGLYSQRGPVCSLVGNSVTAALKRPAGKYCWLPFFGGDVPVSAARLEPQGSVEIEAGPVGGESRTDGPEGTISFSVKEKDFDAFVRELTHPVMLTLNTSSSARSARCVLNGTLYDSIIGSSSKLPVCEDQQLIRTY